MPIAKLKAPGTTNVMKSEEGNDSLDTFIRQAIGKEPLLSFSRAGDSSVQWIQLLQALDQQSQPDPPAWPLLTPLKVQMQKCDKCPQEFCSPINYRRHIRVLHRLKKLDKDSTKNRDLLGAFWDKLSVDEAKEVLSFKNVTLEEVTGSSIVKALTALIRKPGFSSLPQVCLRAGSAFLDIIQARPPRFPLSSQELFSILDDASERTFLCGTAISMQKYIFDGEAGKIGLETKNLVACTSFLVEQKLVKAWLADKDAEALRCQKLLVEEEEAAQKRKAELLERKRQKKLRQKEQKAKEQRHGEKEEVKESSDSTLEAVPGAETCSPLAPSDSDVCSPDGLPDHSSSGPDPFRFSNTEEDVITENQTGCGGGYPDLGTGQNVERRMGQGNGRRHIVVSRWQVPPKSQRNNLPNGFHASHNSHASKLGAMQKHGTHRDIRAAPVVNGNKIWSRKPKPENDGECVKSRVQKETINQSEQNKNHEVMIGSISVALGNCSNHEGGSLGGVQDDCFEGHQMPKKNDVQEKSNKHDYIQCSTNRSTIKLWRPVSRNGTKHSVPSENGDKEPEMDAGAEKGCNQTQSSECCLRSHVVDDNSDGMGNGSASFLEANVQPGSLQYSSRAAKAFLTERWKEAIAGEHVKLVLYPDIDPPGYMEVQIGCEVTVSESSNLQKRSVLGNAENRLVNVAALESSTVGAAKAKFRAKPDKGVKNNLKYIPKQRIIT